nr:pentatricopeptide repeat-containing protein [Tanacetum cinerariifolium]
KRSLPLAFKNDEYDVWEAAGTMDPMTPNRVAVPHLGLIFLHALLPKCKETCKDRSGLVGPKSHRRGRLSEWERQAK